MANPIPSACPTCGGQVDIGASAGGRGTGDLTSYRADCEKCGVLVDHLSGTGRRDSAVRDFNRWARDYRPPSGSTSISVQGGYYASGSIATVDAPALSTRLAGQLEGPAAAAGHDSSCARRTDFSRGYFCAVSVLLRERGEADADVRSLFSQGGDSTQADACDIELFRSHGLMA